MPAYYNEIDPFAAQWLRNLIKAQHIAPGDVDTRSIEDVKPDDLTPYTQCHFFAGIGVWSFALRLAGWADDRCVWTGSCPCQPFSQTGKGRGIADERHLWPAWFHLIRKQRPPVIFGEQVASPAGLAWLDIVQADLEEADNACGAVDLCAAGVGAPHLRQRQFFIAENRMAYADRQRHAGVGLLLRKGRGQRREPEAVLEASGSSSIGAPTGKLGYTNNNGLARRQGQQGDHGPEFTAIERTGGWTGAEWIPCEDGKARPVEPGTFPLAHGPTNHVGRLRGYGNAIIPQVAAEVIGAYMDCRP